MKYFREQNEVCKCIAGRHRNQQAQTSLINILLFLTAYLVDPKSSLSTEHRIFLVTSPGKPKSLAFEAILGNPKYERLLKIGIRMLIKYSQQSREYFFGEKFGAYCPATRGALRQKEVNNNRIGPKVKQEWNVAMNVLHNFLGVFINTTAYHLG